MTDTVDTWLINGEDRAEEHPKTFHIPDETARNTLAVGDFAKIGLESSEGGERFWLKVTEVRTEQGQYEYAGAVDNDLMVFDIPLGEIIEFDAPHVLDILRSQKEPAIQ